MSEDLVNEDAHPQTCGDGTEDLGARTGGSAAGTQMPVPTSGAAAEGVLARSGPRVATSSFRGVCWHRKSKRYVVVLGKGRAGPVGPRAPAQQWVSYLLRHINLDNCLCSRNGRVASLMRGTSHSLSDSPGVGGVGGAVASLRLSCRLQ